MFLNTPTEARVEAKEFRKILNMASMDDEYSWSPPSEAELKVIEAKRERNNKISSLMGQYLLKGYKMLAITCPVCDCVLLEDRSGVKYCIGCSEVDADTKKDNPAVSEEAARKAVEELQHRRNIEKELESFRRSDSNPFQNTSTAPTYQSFASTSLSVATSTTETQLTQSSKKTESLSIHGVDLTEDVAASMKILREKLTWASGQLQATTSVHEARNLAELITESCRAISALRDL